MNIPDGRSGDWRIFTRYGVTTLVRGDVTYMTDDVGERQQMTEAVSRCIRVGGHVLTTGLGLGIFACAICARVRSLTVVENSVDVLRLVLPSIPDGVRIIHGDARRHQPDRRYSVAWHDIWPARPNHHEVESLFAVYRDHCDWQGAWGCP